jgi:uncharacterized protein YcfL
MHSLLQQLSTTLLLSIGAMIALTGCKTTNVVNPTATGGFEQIITNGWLKSKASVVSVHEGVVNGDMKKVAVALFSDQNTQQYFSYKFEWFDSNGMPIPSATQVTTGVVIQAKDTVTVTSVAPSANAARWTLKLYDTQHPL